MVVGNNSLFVKYFSAPIVAIPTFAKGD